MLQIEVYKLSTFNIVDSGREYRLDLPFCMTMAILEGGYRPIIISTNDRLRIAILLVSNVVYLHEAPRVWVRSEAIFIQTRAFVKKLLQYFRIVVLPGKYFRC
ncbi:MAG: hypothetical protein JWN89_710 [Parcubacteria group bacterium]|nr:hypothetical protein [Parcubacteria group bacterium]